LRRAWRRFRRHKLGLFGLIVILVLLLSSLLAPVILPWDPYGVDLVKRYQAPSVHNLLGTDQLGRDILTRVIYAGRVSLMVGVFAVALQMAIGVILGLVSGLGGGWPDEIIQRTAEVFLSFPSLILVFVFVAVFGPSLMNVILSIGLFGWAFPCRLARGEVLSAREDEYVLAARAFGASSLRIALRHILPNIVAPLLVNASLLAATAILYEASLSFLGLGVQPPTPTWGMMLKVAQNPSTLKNYPWTWIPPGVMVSLLVISVNFIGDAVRDALDPRYSRG